MEGSRSRVVLGLENLRNTGYNSTMCDRWMRRSRPALAAMVGFQLLLACTSAARPREGFYDVVYTGESFVAVGSWEPTDDPSEVRALIALSTDGVTWEFIRLPFESPLWSLAFGNGRLVATGSWFYTPPGGLCCDQRSITVFSEDGRTWSQANVTPGRQAVEFAGGMFWIGLDLVSHDGETWGNVSQTPLGADAAMATPERMYAMGPGAGSGATDVYSSADGATWTFECENPHLWLPHDGPPVTRRSERYFFVGSNMVDESGTRSTLWRGDTLCEGRLLGGEDVPFIGDVYDVSGATLVASNTGLWLGEGSGQPRWTRIHRASGGFESLAASDSTIVAVGSSRSLFYSTDDGRSFIEASIADSGL
jgi:hypothetical protein